MQVYSLKTLPAVGQPSATWLSGNSQPSNEQIDAQLIKDEFHRSVSVGFGQLPAARKDNLVVLFQGKSAQQRQAIIDGLQASGVDIEREIARKFEGADAAELKALVRQGRLSDADHIHLALTSSDSEEVRTQRALDRKEPTEIAAMREEYQCKYGKSLDQAIEEGLSGRDLERARQMLAGVEPTTRGRADYISKMMQHHLNAPLVGPGIPQSVNTRQLLDDLHGWSAEELSEASRVYQKATGTPLEEALRDRLTGSDEMMALAYLNDGRESAEEKLLRAISGKNDRELIRKTLEGSDEKTREQIRSNASLLAELKDDLTQTQWTEFQALLNDGQLDRIEKLKVSVVDGGDQDILASLRHLSPQERKAVLKDRSLQLEMKDALDSDNSVVAQSLLARGKEPLDFRISKVDSAKDLYALVGSADPAEREILKSKDWSHLALKGGFDRERLDYLLANGAQTCRDKVVTADNDQDIVAAMRSASPEELKACANDSKCLDKIQDLDEHRKQEAKALLTGKPMSKSESVRHAIDQEDSARILDLVKGDPQLTREYKQRYHKDLVLDLKGLLGRDDFRQAEAALRESASSATQLNDRVRGDMLEDRDDQEVFASASNGILDVFSDAGRDMDDAARQVRANRNNLNASALESNFQERRQEMHVAKAKVADTLSEVAISAIASVATLGAGTGFIGLANAGLRCGLGSLVVEKTLRGNDYSIEEKGAETFGKGFVAGSASKLGDIIKLEDVAAKSSLALSKTEKVFLSGSANGVQDLINESYSQAVSDTAWNEAAHRNSLFNGFVSGAIGQRAKLFSKSADPGLAWDVVEGGATLGAGSLLNLIF